MLGERLLPVGRGAAGCAVASGLGIQARGCGHAPDATPPGVCNVAQYRQRRPGNRSTMDVAGPQFPASRGTCARQLTSGLHSAMAVGVPQLSRRSQLGRTVRGVRRAAASLRSAGSSQRGNHTPRAKIEKQENWPFRYQSERGTMPTVVSAVSAPLLEPVTHKPLVGGSNPPPATSKHSEGRRRSGAVLLRGPRISAHRAHAPVSGRFWIAEVLRAAL